MAPGKQNQNIKASPPLLMSLFSPALGQQQGLAHSLSITQRLPCFTEVFHKSEIDFICCLQRSKAVVIRDFPV